MQRAVPWVCAAALAAGCTETHFGSPRILLFDDGRVGVLVMNVDDDEAGSYAGYLSRSVRSDGVWRSETLRSIGIAGSYEDVLGGLRWVRSRAGVETIAFGHYDASVWSATDGESWTRVELDASVPRPRGLGATWVDADDRLHVLAGSAEHIVSEGAPVRSRPWSAPCTFSELCFFDATGPSGGQAAHYGPPGHFTLYEAACVDTACRFSQAGDLGDTRGDSSWRPFVHTASGVPVLVDRDVVMTPDGMQELVGDTYYSDAAPLSSGGLAIASTTYAGDLLLHVSDEALSFTHTTLSVGTDHVEVAIAARPVMGAPDRIFVVATKGQSAHLVEADATLAILAEEDIPF